MNSYDIEDLTELNKKEWDNFNEIIQDGSFYHTNRWKQILEKSFNLKSHSFIVRFKGEIVAICPIYELMINKYRGLENLPETDYNSVIIKEEQKSVESNPETESRNLVNEIKTPVKVIESNTNQERITKAQVLEKAEQTVNPKAIKDGFQYCSYCGVQNPDFARFCSTCGERLR